MEEERNYACEDLLPYENKAGNKKEQVTQMFDAISERYDFMNKAMTLGVDRIWRKKAILSLKASQPKFMLDVATGTGDFAIEAYAYLKPEKIVGVDISEKMLEMGRIKVARIGLSKSIELTQGDSMSLDYDANVFDAVTVAFGVRNFEKLDRGIGEMFRVLKPGGHLVILEMSEPFLLFKPFYKLYVSFIIPALARFYSKDKVAYNYLPNSIERFPKKKEMKALLASVGFNNVVQRRFTFGVCAFYRAQK